MYYWATGKVNRKTASHFGYTSWYQESKEPGEPQESGLSPKKKKKEVCIMFAAPVIPSFSLQWKSDESTKHYLTQMLLAIKWRYWQAVKNSRRRMKVQGRLIAIHQVFATEKKKKKVEYLSNSPQQKE